MTIPCEEEARFAARYHEYPRTLDCIHCGLCIPFCPTHGVTGREADSPRGRIYLMRSHAEDGEELSGEAEKHILQCIVCRACETVCPSGIRMGDMMESFRAVLNGKRRLPRPLQILGRALLNHILPHRSRIAAISDLLHVYQETGIRRVVQAVARRHFPRVAALDALQPDVPPPSARRIETDRTRPEGYPAEGKARLRVGLFLGCIASEWFAPMHRATIRVLQKNGCDVHILDGQTCCGALHRHAGLLPDSARLYARNAEVFSSSGLDAVIVNAAGCGAALKEPPHDFPRGLGVPVRDVSEFLDEIGIVPPRGLVERRVAHHQACHLVHGQRMGPEVVDNILKLVPGLRLVHLADSDRCCGSGGVYNLVHPEMARPILDDKVRAILESGAELVVTGNPGCALQIRAGLAAAASSPRRAGLTGSEGVIEVLHPVEVLDRSYHGPARSS
ncbi:MAG TPA: (Fe-S)-binding protein [Planctomycetota bacterium]|nr:(Fe-S)-binding protein [Planctomycetota bacterium]